MRRFHILWILIVVGILALGLLQTTVHAADSPIVGTGPYTAPAPAPNPVYAHIGPLNFTLPWEYLNVVYLYDLHAKRNLVGGESVVATLWKLQGTVGAVTSLDGIGAPFVGGNLWFDNPIPQVALLNQVKPGLFGGYDWNAGGPIFGFKAAVAVW